LLVFLWKDAFGEWANERKDAIFFLAIKDGESVCVEGYYRTTIKND